MVRELVLYFLKQGLYSGAGDIAVLCAYLGQLQKVRAALRDLKIAVSVDERDAEQLARQGEEDVEDGFDIVSVGKHVGYIRIIALQTNQLLTDRKRFGLGLLTPFKARRQKS